MAASANSMCKVDQSFAVGYQSEHNSLHAVPASEELKIGWVTFFDGNILTTAANVFNITITVDGMPTGQSSVETVKLGDIQR